MNKEQKVQPKYVLFPGIVTSKTDGDQHYLGFRELACLYKVDLRECAIYEPRPWWTISHYKMAEEQIKGLIQLKPRYDGNYTLPNKEELTNEPKTT
jgi:hypothetical protein